MARQKDTRDYSFLRKSETQVRETAAKASEAFGGDGRVRAERVNPVTGSPAALAAENVTTQQGTLVEKALAHVQEQFTEALGFSPAETPEYVPDPHVQRTTAGTAIVHLHQQYQRIPLFDMTRSVQFGREENVERVVGDNASIAQPLETLPRITASDALRIAAQYLAANEDPPEEDSWGQTYAPEKLQLPPDYSPRIVSVFERPNRPTVLEKGPFGKEVEASLVFFVDGNVPRLSWKLLVTMQDQMEQYLMLVAAHREVPRELTPNVVNDAVLLCQTTTSSVTANVFLHNPGVANRQFVDLPRLANTYPLTPSVQLPNPFPAPWWVETTFTSGNCTTAVRGFTPTSFRGTVNGTNVTFDPVATGDDQRLLNGFFFCNYMHDFFYMLGFDEAAGNFQKVNFGGAGAGNDAVLARVHPGTVNGTANMSTPPDGLPPEMNLGAVILGGGTSRHTALDSDVVFHEYVHGVTNRLVGGRMNSFALQQPQSRGMGEGWGDYFALTIQNHGKPVEKVVTGDWVTNRPGGIRSAPYDQNYPNTYAKVGTPAFTGPHRIGEIWCAALMHMNRSLDAALGAPRGHQLGWQIVVDGLKLAPANPSFVDAREAILQALTALRTNGIVSPADFTLARRSAWEAFAKFGIGANASTLGPSLQGIVEDFTIPAGV